MNKIIGIALAFALIGGVVIVAEGPQSQSADRGNAYSMNFDRCPYYPSPVICHSGSTSRTTVGGLTPSQAAAGVAKS